MADQDGLSLRELFDKADRLRNAVDASYDWQSDEYQDNVRQAIECYYNCKKMIANLALFSPNESLDEVSSSELKYLLTDFYLAQVSLKDHSRDRQTVLKRARHTFNQFLKTCDDYDLLDPKTKGLYDKIVEGSSVAIFPSDPTTRREVKIARFKEEKQLKAKIEVLSKQLHAVDEDIVRDIYTTQIRLAIHQAIQEQEGILQELDLLSKAPPPETSYETAKREVEDARERERRKDGYSDKLDSPSVFAGLGGGPLLSKEGKPLRPFTLVDARSKLKDEVFRPGHNLPTMTIDEYLEEEQRRGNIISGGGEASGRIPTPDEDNYEKADAETYKAREWDEFTEANARGSGNMGYNRG